MLDAFDRLGSNRRLSGWFMLSALLKAEAERGEIKIPVPRQTPSVAMQMISPVIYLSWVLLLLSGCFFAGSDCRQILNSRDFFEGFTRISDFRMVNRRSLTQCPDASPFLELIVGTPSPLADEAVLNVTVSGVLHPSQLEWVAMMSPSHSNVSSCPESEILYKETGDLSNLPFLCHYPVKAQNVSMDPDYLNCKKQECKKYQGGQCVMTTCSSLLQFHVINIRTDIEFVLLGGGFSTPCILKRSGAFSFANPLKPLYGHLSSVDSTGGSMRLTWVSGDKDPQLVQYANGKSATSQVTTFTQNDTCSSGLQSPAKDFGWHDPGYIHSAVMTGLQPSTSYSYRYGSESVGWSDQIQFNTPPAAGSNELRFLAFGDMGKAPRDRSIEHYIQPGSISVVEAMIEEVSAGNVDSIFHIGDISYATGFLVEWDYFLHLITPVASQVPYMTAIGNHERDYMNSGSVYPTPDSGGECGVAYETYFPMPAGGKDKPWYSIEQATVHFTVISTEHDWKEGSEQFKWIKKDLESVNRTKTPWLIFTGHRPMYTSSISVWGSSVDDNFVNAVEPLLMDNKVDLVLFGHVHNYERTCAVYREECISMPTKNKDGLDTYTGRKYSAPVHAIIGMAGFTLDEFNSSVQSWSLSRIREFGYARLHATVEELKVEFVNSKTKAAGDSFRIIRQAESPLVSHSSPGPASVQLTLAFSLLLLTVLFHMK